MFRYIFGNQKINFTQETEENALILDEEPKIFLIGVENKISKEYIFKSPISKKCQITYLAGVNKKNKLIYKSLNKKRNCLEKQILIKILEQKTKVIVIFLKRNLRSN